MKKKITFVLFATLVATSAMLLTQCKSKEKALKMPVGETSVIVLCSGPEYFTNKEYFRANSVGESVNQAQSKRMALSNARAEMAGNINALVSGAVDNYFKQAGVETRSEFAERYEGMFREVVDERLAGVRIICEEVTRAENGNYKTYLAIELAGNEIISAASQRISNDERLRLDYDYERFKKTFEQEIENERKRRGY